MLDETAQQSLIAAIDVAISRCVDAFNIASESDEPELAERVRVQLTELKAFRETALSRPHPAHPGGSSDGRPRRRPLPLSRRRRRARSS